MIVIMIMMMMVPHMIVDRSLPLWRQADSTDFVDNLIMIDMYLVIMNDVMMIGEVVGCAMRGVMMIGMVIGDQTIIDWHAA